MEGRGISKGGEKRKREGRERRGRQGGRGP